MCFMEQRTFFFGKEAVAERARYLAMPLAELPAGQLKEYGGSALRQADWAARLDAVDWQYLQSSRDGDMGDVPGELGQLQVLAAALQVRFRAEVAGRRFDDAIRTAKTMFALSRHLGEHGTEVANLVGLWVAHLDPRRPGRDGATARLPQPLLGADRSALPPGGSAQGRPGGPRPGRGRAEAAPRRRSHDGIRRRCSS